MTNADGLSVLFKHILLITFVIKPVLISWLDLQLGFPLAILLHSKESTLISTRLHLATVGLCHFGHVFTIFAYILGKIKAMTRN